MHETRLEILRALRTKESKNFSDLLSDVAETSDNLTYHLKYLVKDQYVQSPSKGVYRLATKGFLFINTNQDKYVGLFPTLTCMIVVRTVTGRLMMRKQYQPNLGKLHDVTFALYSDGTVTEQIQKFLSKYELAVKNVEYKSTFRKRVIDGGACIFDKVFIVHEAILVSYTPKIGDREFHDISAHDILTRNDLVESTHDIENILANPGFHEIIYKK
jgi:hypothetical protein